MQSLIPVLIALANVLFNITSLGMNHRAALGAAVRLVSVRREKFQICDYKRFEFLFVSAL